MVIGLYLHILATIDGMNHLHIGEVIADQNGTALCTTANTREEEGATNIPRQGKGRIVRKECFLKEENTYNVLS